MAQGKLKLKSKAVSQSKKKHHSQGYKNQAAKSKRGTSNVIASKKTNILQKQKVMKSLTKAINAKAERDLKSRSFQSDGKAFKMLGKVEVSKEEAAKRTSKGSAKSKGKAKAVGKKKKK